MVGGPLLGLFTLGMCVPAANTTGALSGFMSSIILLFWMSFGQPRPKVEHLPLSTDQVQKGDFDEQPETETVIILFLETFFPKTIDVTESRG